MNPIPKVYTIELYVLRVYTHPFRWRSTDRKSWDLTRARPRIFWAKLPDGSTWSKGSSRRCPAVCQCRVSATTTSNCKWCPTTKGTSWLATESSTWRKSWNPAETLSKVSTWWTSILPKVRVTDAPRPSRSAITAYITVSHA